MHKSKPRRLVATAATKPVMLETARMRRSTSKARIYAGFRPQVALRASAATIASLTGFLIATGLLFGTSPAAAQDSDLVVSPAERQVFVSPDGHTTLTLTVNPESVPDSLAALSILEAAPGAVVPEHVHENSAEILHILEGGGTLLLDGDEIQLSLGDTIYIPPNVTHGYRNTTDVGLRAIQVYVAPGPEARFREWTPVTPE